MLPNPTDVILRGVTLYVDVVRLALEVPKTALTILGLRKEEAPFVVADRIEREETAVAAPSRPAPRPAPPRVVQGNRRQRDVQPNGRPRAKDPAPETELVESEGAASPHAQITVDSPWDGYDGMKAADIVARVKTEDQATKAIVLLYEQTHKKRKSILVAAKP